MCYGIRSSSSIWMLDLSSITNIPINLQINLVIFITGVFMFQQTYNKNFNNLSLIKLTFLHNHMFTRTFILLHLRNSVSRLQPIENHQLN